MRDGSLIMGGGGGLQNRGGGGGTKQREGEWGGGGGSKVLCLQREERVADTFLAMLKRRMGHNQFKGSFNV